MDIEDLRASGVLQEANREFFHPLGLALAIAGDRLEILDARDEPGGIIFHDGVLDAQKHEKFCAFRASAHAERQARLGYIVQEG